MTKTITRRELRMRLGSRVIRRANTKTPKLISGKLQLAERPRVRLQKLVRDIRAQGYSVT